MSVTYRHKKISRYSVGRFEFKDHLLTLPTQKDDDEFRATMARQPARESRDIVLSDEKSLESLRSQLRRGSRVVRSAQDSSQVVSGVAGSGRKLTMDDLSVEDKARLEAQAYADARKAAEDKVAQEMKDAAAKQAAADAAVQSQAKDNPEPTKQADASTQGQQAPAITDGTAETTEGAVSAKTSLDLKKSK